MYNFKIPVWIRRLPHNLSTIRPFASLKFDLLKWGLAVGAHLDLNPGDKNYMFHYERGPLLAVDVGPVQFAAGMKDTPEENAWLK